MNEFNEDELIMIALFLDEEEEKKSKKIKKKTYLWVNSNEHWTSKKLK